MHPDTVLEPYNVRLGQRAAPGRPGGPPIWAWADDVANQLLSELHDVTRPHLVVLAGEQYRTVLHRIPSDWTHEVPLAGLGIGQQLAWLTKHA